MVAEKKIRVNISVDRVLLNKAKKKLHLFGGKLSTLFGAYLKDFVEGVEKGAVGEQKLLKKRIDDIEERLERVERK